MDKNLTIGIAIWFAVWGRDVYACYNKYFQRWHNYSFICRKSKTFLENNKYFTFIIAVVLLCFKVSTCWTGRNLRPVQIFIPHFYTQSSYAAAPWCCAAGRGRRWWPLCFVVAIYDHKPLRCHFGILKMRPRRELARTWFDLFLCLGDVEWSYPLTHLLSLDRKVFRFWIGQVKPLKL